MTQRARKIAEETAATNCDVMWVKKAMILVMESKEWFIEAVDQCWLKDSSFLDRALRFEI